MRYKLLLAIALILAGCGGPKAVYDQPGSEDKGYFETAWVDPKVVLEDPWYSLMRSKRIDSFFVASPADNPNPANRSVRFDIKNYECPTVVNLLNGRSEVVRPLLVKNLGPGYYKLTLNIGQLKKEKLPPDNYYLKAEYCGFTVIQDLGRM